jgi:hypothetical protein
MDLMAVIAELNDISARLAERPSSQEAEPLRRRQKELRTQAQVFDVEVRRPEYERELTQLERRVAEMTELEIRHRDSGRGFLRGALWGDYEFPKDAEKLNAKMGAAMDRPKLERRVAELRSLLGLPPAGDLPEA